MLKYIIQDLVSVVRYLPWGVVMGAVLSMVFLWAVGKVGRGKGKFSEEIPTVAFWNYLSVMLIITFFSRESGSRQGVDLQLFSTWGINARNNAYVVENVLLFIPYGFVGACAFRFLRRFHRSFIFGFATSLGIELLQLATQRGFFQIDDILTNTLGTAIGFLFYKLSGIVRRKR